MIFKIMKDLKTKKKTANTSVDIMIAKSAEDSLSVNPCYLPFFIYSLHLEYGNRQERRELRNNIEDGTKKSFKKIIRLNFFFKFKKYSAFF